MTRETKKMMETQRNALRSGLVHERPRRHAHDKESEQKTKGRKGMVGRNHDDREKKRGLEIQREG